MYGNVKNAIFSGLFQRAILHSGSALNPWSITKCFRERAFRLGEAMGCKTEDDQVLMDFFRTVPALEFAKYVQSALSKEVRERRNFLRTNT